MEGKQEDKPYSRRFAEKVGEAIEATKEKFQNAGDNAKQTAYETKEGLLDVGRDAHHGFESGRLKKAGDTSSQNL